SLPETTLRTKESLVTMKKRGRLLSASYEAVRFHRLDLFTVTLRHIGATIAKTLLADAVDVLINGDGSSGTTAGTVSMSGGNIAYADLISLWNSFDPFEMTTILASAAQMEELLALDEMRDAAAGLNFHGAGRMITPLGAELIKSAAVPAGKIVALDKNCALEMVKAGEIVTDYDKLIDRQLDRAAISATVGFAKLFPGAAKVLQ
ncbi:MAG: phage major capsid protein, partial [Oscillospiraceae bacterium]|nr:phage major capsid protein [Oscillospiraceae bacterium]